jgi:hypothetical protein
MPVRLSSALASFTSFQRYNTQPFTSLCEPAC